MVRSRINQLGAGNKDKFSVENWKQLKDELIYSYIVTAF